MKSNKAFFILALSIVIGIIAVVLAARWMNEKSALATTDVVVAATDITLGTQLSPQQLKVVRWPTASTPAGTFNDTKALNARVLLNSVQTGEPVLEKKLAPVGSKGGLSAIIAEGKRAISVKVKEDSGVAGFALPGNYVDVLVSAQDQQGNPVSRIVLQRILVLAVAQEAGRDETKPMLVNAVTLEVTPDEAEKLDLARSVGQLSLALRNQIDTSDASTSGADISDLIGSVAPPRLPPSEPIASSKTADPAPKKISKSVPRKVVTPKAVDRPAPTETADRKPAFVEGVQVSE